MFPEEMIDDDGALLRLELRCTGCGHKRRDSFRWACVDPAVTSQDGWDGVVLSHVVVCKRCGAVDEYELTATARIHLTGGVLRRMVGESTERVIYASNTLFDGTQVRRASQAIAHLRALADREPNNAEVHRRLGNTLERFGEPDAAVEHWHKAVELDDDDFEATYSLALALWDDPERQADAFGYLRDAFRKFPRARREDPNVARFGDPLVLALRQVVRQLDEPFALAASWQSGSLRGKPVVHVSSIDVRDIEDFRRLGEFIVRDDVLMLDFVAELPTDEVTQLAVELGASGDVGFEPAPMLSVSSVPVRRGPKVGRNQPCPCGSGRKYKRCCGG